MHDYIPAIIVDEGKNAVLANQSSSSTNVKEVLCHDVIFSVLYGRIYIWSLPQLITETIVSSPCKQTVLHLVSFQ